MRNKNKPAIVIRWVARIWGTLILAFVLFFLIAHIFGNDESGEGLRNTKEIITFICFPISTVIGLAMAYKWEGIGGLIACLGLIVGQILNYVADLKFMVIIFPPGLLYLIYWFMTKKEKHQTTID